MLTCLVNISIKVSQLLKILFFLAGGGGEWKEWANQVSLTGG